MMRAFCFCTLFKKMDTLNIAESLLRNSINKKILEFY
jgi:hypothetical protein